VSLSLLFPGDVGGGRGLFVGASAISVCELIDFFIVVALGAAFEMGRKKFPVVESKHVVETKFSSSQQ